MTSKKQHESENRRYTLLVESYSRLEGDAGTMVTGRVHGTVDKDDTVYILQPGKEIQTAKINGIEIDQGNKVDEATDQTVSLLISDVSDKFEMLKYTVITNIKPQAKTDTNVDIENPYLLALSLENERFGKEKIFFEILIYELTHGHYLVPVCFEKEPENFRDGTSTLREETRIHFMSIKKPDDETQNIFPVFTDNDALQRRNTVIDERHETKKMIFKFSDCITITKSGNSGMVINPYGPVPVYIPMSLIEYIENLEGYQSEFSADAKAKAAAKEKDENDTAAKDKGENDTEVMVGYPKKTKEVKQIRENLKAYGKNNDAVKRIDLLWQIEEGKDKTYLCIVDCPEEKSTDIFNEIYKAVGSCAQETKIIDFLTYENAEFVYDVINNNRHVYVRKNGK